MVSVSTSLSLVSSSATWSSLITERHSRGARPSHRTRTPSSCISSRRRRMTSRLKPIRNRTSSGERVQFSVEKAYADTAFTPISMAPSTTSNSECSPRSGPAVRGRPRCLAHRPLPSITIATCPGTSSLGRTGGRAPDGCGSGRRTSGLLRAIARLLPTFGTWTSRWSLYAATAGRTTPTLILHDRLWHPEGRRDGHGQQADRAADHGAAATRAAHPPLHHQGRREPPAL